MSRHPRRTRWLLWLPLALLLLLGAAACAKNAPQDTLTDLKGPAAQTIDDLIKPVFIVAGVVFVLVEGMVLVFSIRYRRRKGSQDPVQIEGNTRLEFFWTLVPAAVLLAIAVPTLFTIFKLARTPKDAINVTVVGHQWWWEYRYDDLGVVTANELHMPVGQPLRIKLQSADVIHSFWVPKLAGKTDAVPGRTNHMNLEASVPGEFLGQCVEFCGTSHANMRNKAFAHTPADFNAWVLAQKAAAGGPADGSPASEGLPLFNQKGCAGCHTVQGVSKGTTGPNLTHVYSRTSFAGANFAMTPENLSKWLADPPREKPGSLMPDLNLSQDEITKLVAYLESLK